METLVNYLGYSTYLLGSLEELTESNQILLYNEADLVDVGKISTYTINDVYYKVLDTGNYLILNKSDKAYSYYPDSSNITGFNVIIYLNTSNNAVGYTKFINTQGLSGKVNLTLQIESEAGNVFEVNLVNSLSQLQGTSTKSIIGDRLNDYLSVDDFNKFNIDNIHLGYITSDIIDSSKNSKIISLNSCSLIEDKLYGLPKLSTKLDKFDNFFIGICKNDLAILGWSGNKFTIYSLTKKDKFNNPIRYTFTEQGLTTKTLPLYLESDPNQIIMGFSGNFLIVLLNPDTLNSERLVYDYVNDYWLTDVNVVVNEGIDSTELIVLPKIINYYNLYQSMPFVRNLYLDVEAAIDSSTAKILRVQNNNWLVLSKRTDLEDSVYISNSFGYLKIPAKDINVSDIQFLNDRVVLIPKSGKYILYEIVGEVEIPLAEINLSNPIDSILTSYLNNYRRKSILYINSLRDKKIKLLLFKGLIFCIDLDTLKIDYI